MAAGAPTNEYDADAADLVRLVVREDDMTEKMVKGIWARWFGDEHQATEGVLAELTVGVRSIQIRFADA